MDYQEESVKPKTIIKGGDPLNLRPRQFKSDKINADIRNFFKKKIKLNSAFDQKGSKHFLHSKKAALQQIVIDDNESSNNDSDTKSRSIKRKKFKQSPVQTCVNRNKAQSSNNLVNLMHNNQKNKTQDSKDKNFRKGSMIRTIVTNELNVHKRLNKNFSSQESKMLEDREIRKIKPIKKNINEEKADNENKHIHKFFPFVESGNSFDSSLFNMVSQIK